MPINPKLTQAFRSQSMADKQEFIDSNLYYASMRAIAGHCNAYIFDLLDAVDDPELIADWLRKKGYLVTKQNDSNEKKGH